MSVAAIIRRIDAALASMATQTPKLEPRAIYLTADDYEALARARTKRYRQTTGSSAFLWPCSYGDVPLVSRQLAAELDGQMAVPVRRGKGSSCIYSTHGVAVRVPTRAPK